MSRIAVVGPLPPLKGGISQHTARVAEALVAAGHEVEAISWRSQYPKRLYPRASQDSTAETSLDVAWLLRWFDPISWLRTARRTSASEILFLPWVSPFHSVPYLFLLLAARKRTRVIHVHNVTPHESVPFANYAARIVLNRANLIVCHAESIRDQLRAIGVQTRVEVTAHPPDLPVEWTPLPPRPPFKLLFAGTIRNYKGLDIALEAVLLLDEPVALTVAGEVWHDHPELDKARFAARGIDFDLRLRYIPDAELIELLSTHHVLLAPYRSATQSGIVSLAHAAGRPVVATNVGGLPDAVTHGETGILIEPEDPQAFAAGIRQAIASLDELAANVAAQTPTWRDYVGSDHRFA